MKFRMLKGFGRLMLKAGLLCGVGLFLCSSEVRAEVSAPTANITSTTDTELNNTRFTITITNNNGNGDGSITVSEVALCTDTSCNNVFMTKSTNLTIDDNSGIGDISITNGEFIGNADNLKSGENQINGIKLTYTIGNDTKSQSAIINVASLSAKTNTIYKISNPSFTNGSTSTTAPYKTNATDATASFKIKVGDRTFEFGQPGYGYAGQEYSVITSGNLAYYVNVYHSGSTAPTWDSGEFKDSAETEEFSFGTITADVNDLKVQYFPKLTDVWFDLDTSKRTIYLGSTGDVTSETLTIKLKNENGELVTGSNTDDIATILENMAIVPVFDGSNVNINEMSWQQSANNENIKIKFNSAKALTSTATPGTAVITAMAKNKIEGGNAPINNVTGSLNPLNLTVYANPTGLKVLKGGSEISGDTISTGKTAEYDLQVIPGGADQTLTLQKATPVGESYPIYSVLYDSTSKKLKLTAGSTANTGDVTISANANNAGGTTNLSTTFNAKVVTFSASQTKDKIEKSNENFITIGDNYKLDIAELVKKYATDGTNHIEGMVPKKITISTGSDYAEVVDNTKIRGKKEGTAEISVYFDDNSAAPDITGLKIGIYPMPTAKYNSDRTVTVKIPTKVSAGLSDDKNIRKSTGFKLILEDANGNSLHEYTDSKYQSKLSSSSDYAVSYTISVADIEGMITSAASNGKFSTDTTSVKFKVIPMGYKQSASSDETIKAKDEIAGKTDSVTVYKVSATGTNFATAAAYGLDGQTITLTATPNSGYTFKQWSDGNTSNPRQIKVSASGTRSFQAVAGERVPGGAGSDNSELYDDVPKTAESNSAIWLIIFMVFAVMGTTYALYLQLKAANSKNDK